MSALTLELDLACPADHAFTVWTTRIDSWWPADHTVSGRPEQIVLQGHVGSAPEAAADIGRDRNRHGWTTLLPHFATATTS